MFFTLQVAGTLLPEMEEAMRKRSGSDRGLIDCAAALRATSRQRTEALALALRGNGA